jgi:hypothetical protein
VYDDPPSVEALQRKLAIAFADVPYPGDGDIGHAPQGHVLEADQVADFLRGRAWQEVTYRNLVEDYSGDHRAVLYFMSPKAFRYYLPVLLITTFDYLLEASDKDAEARADEIYAAHSSLAFALTRPESVEDQAWFDERVEGFSAAQKTAIRSFLEFVLVEHSNIDPSPLAEQALAALDGYWRTAADGSNA